MPGALIGRGMRGVVPKIPPPLDLKNVFLCITIKKNQEKQIFNVIQYDDTDKMWHYLKNVSNWNSQYLQIIFIVNFTEKEAVNFN